MPSICSSISDNDFHKSFGNSFQLIKVCSQTAPENGDINSTTSASALNTFIQTLIAIRVAYPEN